MINEKQYCSKCGVAMNHHADKINEVILLQTQKALGEDFNGVIEAVFTCPTCGETIESALQQTRQTEKPFIKEEYKPRTSRRLRFTYSGLL